MKLLTSTIGFLVILSGYAAGVDSTVVLSEDEIDSSMNVVQEIDSIFNNQAEEIDIYKTVEELREVMDECFINCAKIGGIDY
jgi:hypothetical protein